MKSMCSRKWARPGALEGSERWPTRTSMAAADLSVVGSEMRRHVRLLGSWISLYFLSSCWLASMAIGIAFGRAGSRLGLGLFMCCSLLVLVGAVMAYDCIVLYCIVLYCIYLCFSRGKDTRVCLRCEM